LVAMRVIGRYARPGTRAIDPGPGAQCERLHVLGCEVVAGNRDATVTLDVDSLPARPSFLFERKTRMMDEVSDPTHLCPIFSDLLRRPVLPRAGLRIAEPLLLPPNGFERTRKVLAWPLAVAAAVFPGASVLGDNHIFVFKAAA
jgi:hypothetical protein